MRKKQSRQIARLALNKGIIEREVYNQLYIDTTIVPGRKFRLVEELYHGSWSYYGEWDECSLIGMVEQILYFSINRFGNDLRIIEPAVYFNTPKKIIQYLKGLKNHTYPNPLIDTRDQYADAA